MVDNEISSVSNGGDHAAHDDEYYRGVIGHQVEFVKSLNDELVRTIRLHTAIITVLATGFAVVGFDVLLSPARSDYLGVPTPLFWLFGGIGLMAGLGLWMNYFFGYSRVRYSDLHLGVESGEDTALCKLAECNADCIETREDAVAKTQTRLMVGLSLIVAGLLLLSM